MPEHTLGLVALGLSFGLLNFHVQKDKGWKFLLNESSQNEAISHQLLYRYSLTPSKTHKVLNLQSWKLPPYSWMCNSIANYSHGNGIVLQYPVSSLLSLSNTINMQDMCTTTSTNSYTTSIDQSHNTECLIQKQTITTSDVTSWYKTNTIYNRSLDSTQWTWSAHSILNDRLSENDAFQCLKTHHMKHEC